MNKTTWKLNQQEYLEAPGLSALIFHDFYPEGKQGGIEIIQHDVRVAACGDLRVEPTPGQWDPRPDVGERRVNTDRQEVSVPLHFTKADIRYTITIHPEGRSLIVTVDLDQPLTSEWEDKVGFNLELFPGGLFGKTFHLGATTRVFPRQSNGPRLKTEEGVQPMPLATGDTLSVAPEDPAYHLAIESLSGQLTLYDGRDTASNGWFVVRETLSIGAKEHALTWRITPHAIDGWQRTPVICISQVGYHPEQLKHAILELDPRASDLDTAVLQRIQADGSFTEVFSSPPSRWGRFLRYTYAIFDFTTVRQPGMYRVCYGDQRTPPFKIHPEVYQHNVWQPTLETFFPVQMCHMAVKDKSRVWHGACHLDDALQAPPQHQHFDGYRQYEETETPYDPHTHIPHLNRGGWHDAGDYDLAAGSQARTTHTLVLIRELFNVDTDQTTVKRDERLVLLHTPDGAPDIVEQIAHGVENLLSGYRAAGHSFHGIIANSLIQYTHLGDASTMTDNRIYDASLAPGEIDGQRSGTQDDRWAFTNHDTALEYLVAGALAASSRVLRDYDAALADEALSTAIKVWQTEHAQAPVSQRGGYVPRDPKAQELLAALELHITTGEQSYAQRLVELWPTVKDNLVRVGGTAARALPYINDPTFEQQLRAAVVASQDEITAELAKTPFGIPFHPHIWGIGWQIQGYAVQLYHLHWAFPDLIDRELILRVVNYVLGCHPASNTSLVSGVGARSATVAYGVNRADWSYIPGGMLSGPALIRPDFPELKEPFAFLWQQTEYVMPGAANYIFCILAADQMLNG